MHPQGNNALSVSGLNWVVENKRHCEESPGRAESAPEDKLRDDAIQGRMLMICCSGSPACAQLKRRFGEGRPRPYGARDDDSGVLENAPGPLVRSKLPWASLRGTGSPAAREQARKRSSQ